VLPASPAVGITTTTPETNSTILQKTILALDSFKPPFVVDDQIVSAVVTEGRQDDVTDSHQGRKHHRHGYVANVFGIHVE
jgi:hypothetical protein